MFSFFLATLYIAALLIGYMVITLVALVLVMIAGGFVYELVRKVRGRR